MNAEQTTAVSGSLFVLAVGAFLWWKTSLFAELRAWLRRGQASRSYGCDLKALDDLLSDRVRLTGEIVENQLALSRFVDRPVNASDEILKTLDMLEAARLHLLRMAAQVGLGEESVLVPEKKAAAVIPLKTGPEMVWQGGKLMPKERR